MSSSSSLPSSLTQKKSLIDVFTSIREVIISQQESGFKHEPTSTEFFAVLVTVLSTNVETNHLIQLLTLLDGVIPTTSVMIVKEQFKIISNTLLKIIKLATASMNGDDMSNKEMNRIIRLSLVAIGTLLSKQELSDGFWGSLPALQSLNNLLGYIDDDINNKTRKDVVDKLMSLLILHSKNTSNSNNKFFRNYISDFCIGVINSCNRSNYKRTLYIIMFLETALPLLSPAKQLAIIGKTLALQICNQPILNAALFRMLDSYYQSPRYSLNPEQTISSIKVLLENNPLTKTKDMEATAFFCTTVASALRNSNKLSNALTISILPSCLDALLDCLDCEFMQIHVAISTSIRRIITEFIDTEMIRESVAVSTNKDYKITLKVKCFNIIISKINTIILDLRHKNSWEYTLNIVQSLFDVVKNDNAFILLKSIVLSVVNLYENTIIISIGTDINNTNSKETDLNNALYGLFTTLLGHILKSMGTKNFLSVTPLILSTSANYIGVDSKREWIINLLHNNLKSIPGKLNDFIDLILGNAKKANDVLRFNATKNSTSANGIILKKSQLKTLKSRVLQLWSLLPDFCDSNHGITDIITALPRISKILEMTLKDTDNYSDLRPFIVSSLTIISKNIRDKYPTIDINSTSIPKEVELLKEQSQIFLPILLNFIDNEIIDISDSNFQSISACISAWASISNNNLIVTIAKRLLQLLITNTITSNDVMTIDNSDNNSSENIKYSGYITVLQAIIPYLSENILVIILKTIKPLLEVEVSLSLQKRSYAILDCLLKSHFSIIYKKFELESSEDNALLEIVSHNVTRCHISARNMRLRCLLTLLQLLIENNYNIEIINIIYRKIFNDILICLKDNNKKTRDNSHQILKIFMEKINFNEFITSIYGIITTVVKSNSNTSKASNSLKASALIAACMLLFEKRESRNVTNTIINAIFPVVSQLLLLENSEISKSCLSFLRVVAALVPLSILLNDEAAMNSTIRRYSSTVLLDSNINILENIITNITVSIGQTLKNKYSSRVRAILRKLHKRVGSMNNGGVVTLSYNSMDNERSSENSLLRQYLPDKDVPLLEYIIKQQKRSDRKSKKAVNQRGGGGEGSTNQLDDLLGSDSEDDDDDNDNNTSAGAIDYRANKADRPKALRLSDTFGATMNALPNSLSHMVNEIQYSKHSKDTTGVANEKDDEDDDYKVSITDAGHVVVSEKNGVKANEGKSNRKRRRDDDDNDDDNDNEAEAAAMAAKEIADANAASLASLPKFINATNDKESTSSKRVRREPGEEYRSKKSGGDVWRRGMLEPHAFIPLDPRLFNIKKNFGEAVTHLSSVVKGKGGGRVNKSSKSSNKPSVSKAVFNKAQLGSRKQREAARRNKK